MPTQNPWTWVDMGMGMGMGTQCRALVARSQLSSNGTPGWVPPVNASQSTLLLEGITYTDMYLRQTYDRGHVWAPLTQSFLF